MSFTPAVSEQLFVLATAGGLADLTKHPRHADATDDIVEAVLIEAGRFAEREWAPLSRRGDREGARWQPDGVRMPEGYRDAYRRFVADGWGAIGGPTAWGGQGLPFCIQAAVLETLGSANMAFTLAPILTAGAVETLSRHGSPAQHARYLPRLVSGEWTGTMNLTEPQAGSDLAEIRTTATPRGDGIWSIRGTKIFISFGDHDLADNIIHLVLARTPDAPSGNRGISLFLVPKFRLSPDGLPGQPNDIRTVSIELKLGLHASPTCVLSFGEDDDCAGELVGPEGGGLRAMFTMMNNARLNVGLQGVQVAEAATQVAVAYALERVQGVRNGRPVSIAEHPDVRRMLLRMKAQTHATRMLVYHAGGLVDRAALGDGAARLRLDLVTPLAKAHATDVGNEIASLGVQVHGGMGFVEETGVARFLRDARITPIYEGTNGIQAADLVMRKLDLADGTTFDRLIEDVANDVRNPHLVSLVAACGEIGERFRTAGPDDRLAGSYPFLTMLSVALCGWLLERADDASSSYQASPVQRQCARFYLDNIVPEALGLRTSAVAGAAQLFDLPAAALSQW